ncbi:alpha/beta fold hydrolase [Asaia sp. As-1742]|uniref:alpha/beta fold hydrolase n=1 Tax=Asaia sp. As-1742 TaxID=2608325 RepID=UPI001F0409B2|nr:alpha/beta fold hydrolase [Asaia sp. As-1742]
MIREFRPHSNHRRRVTAIDARPEKGKGASISPRAWLARLVPVVICGLILSGCTTAPPRHAPQPRGQEAALVSASMHITLSDGAVAPLRVWPAKAPMHAIILALHGFGDSRDAWEFSAPQLAASGIETIAPDARGFGETTSRGRWSSTARLVQDAREEARFIHARNPTVPLFIMGESMGGAVATILAADPQAAREGAGLSGVILVSPAIWRFDPFSRLVLQGLDTIAPDWVFTGAHVPGEHIATNNIAALRRLYFDPLTLHEYRLDTLHGLVELMAASEGQARNVQLPMLVLYGNHDQMIPAPPMASFWHHLPAGVRKDLIPGGHHLLLRDRNGRNATGDIASWILHPDQLLPSGGDAAAAAWMAGDPGHFGP